MRVKNVNRCLSWSLTTLRVAGFWAPQLEGTKRILYHSYGFFSFMFLLGMYLIIQIIELNVIWGNIPLMTGVGFVLFSNLTQSVKILYTVVRRERVMRIVEDADEVLRAAEGEEPKEIVRRCNRETWILYVMFNCITSVTLAGWASSAEKGQLPFLAWYPYDTSKSPAYELTFLHQIVPQYIAACLNVCKDTLVTSLLAQTCCRLRLLKVALRDICRDMEVGEYLLTADQEAVVRQRISSCVVEHQRALAAAVHIQECFSEPIFAQFNVSLVIICVTAFQLVSQTGNLIRFVSMGTYLLNMMYQVFLYCYQGNELSEESSEIVDAVYQAPWYAMSVPLRRSLLIIMVRSRRIAQIKAGSFTILSLASFMAIIKTSYSLFTLLQQVEEKE